MIFFGLRWALRIVIALIVIVVLYFAVTAVQVWLTSRQSDPRPADAIVVMGSAEYDGTPSPDLAARLDEAIALWRAGVSHTVMVTGGREAGDVYTEAEAATRYLETHGVPAGDILQAGGNDSWENLDDAAPVLRRHGVSTVDVVTDPFHEDRSMAIASQLGFQPYPNPTRTSPITGWATVPYFAKETLGVGLGRILGYQHLEWLHHISGLG